MKKIAGMRCEVCDRVVILFSRENDGIVITIDCQRCGKDYYVSFGDIVYEKPHFCCDYELLPTEFDELQSDFLISVVCHGCGAENEVSTEEAFTALSEEEGELVLDGTQK